MNRDLRIQIADKIDIIRDLRDVTCIKVSHSQLLRSDNFPIAPGIGGVAVLVIC